MCQSNEGYQPFYRGLYFCKKIRMEQHIYEVGLEWQSQRKGWMNAPRLETGIEVATPPHFRWDGRNMVSPNIFLPQPCSAAS